MSSPTDDLSQRIKAELTKPLWNKLVLYAHICIRKHTWHGVLGGLPLNSKSAEDFLQDAVMKTWNAACGGSSHDSEIGKRNWNPAKCTLEQHLRRAVESDINHDSDCVANRSKRQEGSFDSDDPEGKGSFLDGFAAETATIEETERLEEWETMLFRFLDELTDDRPVQQLFEAIYDGKIKRADQAKLLGVPETQIDAIKKRLATRAKNFTTNHTQKSKEVSHA